MKEKNIYKKNHLWRLLVLWRWPFTQIVLADDRKSKLIKILDSESKNCFFFDLCALKKAFT